MSWPTFMDSKSYAIYFLVTYLSKILLHEALKTYHRTTPYNSLLIH